MTDRRLVLMRHGKAESFASNDHDRALTERGRRDVRSTGEHLAALGIVPDTALISSSVRTVETFQGAAEGAGWAVGWTSAVAPDNGLYSGSSTVLVAAIREVPAGAGTVLYVGHNPTAAYVCHLLDDGVGDPDATNRLFHGFPTAAVAVLEVRVPWAELEEESGRLVDFYVPRR
ncbi:MAG: SixA phosphatase family protein [Nocardioidaceae bacterium]